MKTYRGSRDESGAVVTVDGQPLDPRLDLANKSPTGLDWGYSGSGPAQLALAILADLYGPKFAIAWFQLFKWKVISRLPQGEQWELTQLDVQTAMAEITDGSANEDEVWEPAQLEP